MLNGKFYTGLPPKMIDRNTTGPNRQQSNFFWPDESQSESVRETQTKRRNNVLSNQKDNFPVAEKADVQTKQMFNNEFSKSSIQFNDVIPKEKQKRNEQKLDRNESNVAAKRSSASANTSKIQFYDFDDDLNNIPRTDKNVKREIERNTKNSPKLQDKRLTFDERGIKIIENNVKNIKIDVERRDSGEPKRILKKSESEYNVRDNSRRQREREMMYEDEIPIRKNGGRGENEGNYDNYDRDYGNYDRSQNSSSRNRTVEVNYHDEYDGEYNDYDQGRKSQNYPKSPIPRPRLRPPTPDRFESNMRKPSGYNERTRYNDNYSDHKDSPSPPPTSRNTANRLTPTTSQIKSHQIHNYADTKQSWRNENENNSKVRSNSNDQNQNYEQYQQQEHKQQQSQSKTPPRTHSPPQQSQSQHHQSPNQNQKHSQPQVSSSKSDTYNRAHKHLVSNIHFNDNQTSDNTPTTTPQRRNIRSSAVMRVSVGLPD